MSRLSETAPTKVGNKPRLLPPAPKLLSSYNRFFEANSLELLHGKFLDRVISHRYPTTHRGGDDV